MNDSNVDMGGVKWDRPILYTGIRAGDYFYKDDRPVTKRMREGRNIATKPLYDRYVFLARYGGLTLRATAELLAKNGFGASGYGVSVSAVRRSLVRSNSTHVTHTRAMLRIYSHSDELGLSIPNHRKHGFKGYLTPNEWGFSKISAAFISLMFFNAFPYNKAHQREDYKDVERAAYWLRNSAVELNALGFAYESTDEVWAEFKALRRVQVAHGGLSEMYPPYVKGGLLWG